MFTPLGLFQDASCPDAKCNRPRCFFSHSLKPINGNGNSEAGPSRPKVTKVTSSVEKRTIDGSGTSPVKRPKLGSEHAASAPAPSPVLPVARKPIRPPPPASPGKAIADPSRPPSIPTNIKLSPQPWADRQKALTTLYTQYTKLYAPILALAPDLARTSALAQEDETSKSCGNLRAYKTAIHHAAVSISRRPSPDSLSHPSIGTLRESRILTEAAEKEMAGRLTKMRVEKYCLPKAEFAEWGYPDPDDAKLVNPPLVEPSAEGTEKNCDRCKVAFIVSAEKLAERFGECRYHHGRTAPERVEGKRKWIYTCCRKERGEAGCEEGIHVFRDGDDDAKLASRVPFVRTDLLGGKGALQVVGMDCEMIYTVGGSSLARVTIVDESGATVLDEVVRQNVAVLDVNTRFSGIELRQLSAAIMDITAVRAAAGAFIGPETIIVGHGLENDLRALRLLHEKVIDTAVLFPHDKGKPFRRALRDIVKEKLGFFIQDRTSDLGHSSAVDAKAALDLLRWRVRDDQKDIQ